MSETEKGWYKACCEWQPYKKPHEDEGQCCGKHGNKGTDQNSTNKTWCYDVTYLNAPSTKILTKKEESEMVKGLRSFTKKAVFKFVGAVGKGGHDFAEAAGGGDAEESD